jgi:hypothetical protein
MALSFGFSTLVDLLSWIAVLTLGAKMIATFVLLFAGKGAGDRPS